MASVNYQISNFDGLCFKSGLFVGTDISSTKIINSSGAFIGPITASSLSTTGTLTVTGLTTLKGSATISGTLSVLGAATFKSNASVSGTLSVLGVATFKNNATISGTLAVTGASTFTSTATASAFIPTGSSVPANGMYLSAANAISFATNSALAGTISASGIWTWGISGATSFHTLRGSLTVTQSGDVTMNAVSTAINQNALVDLQMLNGSTSGGAYILCRRLSASGANWAFGLDVATSDQFAIVNGTAMSATKYLTLTTTSGVSFKGTTTNNSATAGFNGEYIESVISSYTNLPAATTVWGNMTSISLTAGDWDVTGIMNWIANGATATNGIDLTEIAVSVNSGATTTDHVQGSNQIALATPNSTADRAAVISCYRISIASTTTIYFKILSTYSVATPQYKCRLSARRIR